jgi:DNA-directed RNA polymerase subunit M/transcription elongation factor TFIIS
MSNKSIESLIEYKLKLEKEENSEILLSVIQKLDAELSNYSIEDMTNSKIGKALKVLSEESKHEEIKKKCVVIMNNMRTMLKKDKAKEEKKEVSPKKGNVKDENKNYKEDYKKVLKEISNSEAVGIRKNVKILLFDALIHKEQCSLGKLNYIKEFSKKIEETLYIHLYSSSDKGGKYLQRAKSIVFNLGKGDEFKEKILSNQITSDELVSMDVKDMAPSELKVKREKQINDGFNADRNDWASKNAVVVEGMYTCECGSVKTTFFQLQIRGADEPMTSFITCVECKMQWTFN